MARRRLGCDALLVEQDYIGGDRLPIVNATNSVFMLEDGIYYGDDGVLCGVGVILLRVFFVYDGLSICSHVDHGLQRQRFDARVVPATGGQRALDAAAGRVRRRQQEEDVRCEQVNARMNKKNRRNHDLRATTSRQWQPAIRNLKPFHHPSAL